MTINEEQELKVLQIFITNKIDRFNLTAFPPALTKAVGNGEWALVQNMIRDGFVADLHTQEYEFTLAGKNRYRLLIDKRRNELITRWAFWTIFACTLITVADIIYKHAYPESIPKIEATQKLKLHPTTQIVLPKVQVNALNSPKK